MTNMPGVQLSQRGSRKIIVAVVVVLAVILVALIGAEFYARHHAASLVADAVQCEARDTADVSFSAAPPVLLQYLAGHYSTISVQTAGNQVRNAKGMKVDLTISDIHVQHTADSKGTIGSLDGTITWSSDGIKQSIQDAVPVLGSVVTSSVTTCRPTACNTTSTTSPRGPPRTIRWASMSTVCRSPTPAWWPSSHRRTPPSRPHRAR